MTLGAMAKTQRIPDAATRFAIRVTIAALVTFALVHLVHVPLHGLWAVLTAVVVTQASVGGSIRASLNYVAGTVAGAVYASIVSLLVPHMSVWGMAGALALALTPLAYAAAKSEVFRVAPFTAVIVLILAGQFGQGPVEAALTRSFEVALGGGIAVMVSLLIFPEKAHRRGREAAAEALDALTRTLPVLLGGLFRQLDIEELHRLQNAAGARVAAFDAAMSETRHEQALSLSAQPEIGPLSRTLLRLRHDLVMIGRAASNPLPDAIGQRLMSPVQAAGAAIADHLAASAAALRAARALPPALGPVESAVAGLEAEVATLRSEGHTRPLSTGEVEQLFALGFAFDQLRGNLADLDRCIVDWCRA